MDINSAKINFYISPQTLDQYWSTLVIFRVEEALSGTSAASYKLMDPNYMTIILDCLDPLRVPHHLVDARREGDPVEPLRRRDQERQLRPRHHRRRRGGPRHLRLPDQLGADAEHCKFVDLKGGGGLHSTVVVFALLTRRPRVVEIVS